jgi:pilus assembly protein CpaF
MAQQKNLSAEMAQFLDIAARCRVNILISGGTGSGKTTLLNAVSRHIDSTERIVTIEDAVELRLQQPHVVQLESRPPNIEGAGAINQRELLRNALRMRPDRIIVGEVRGNEAFDMLQAMNTGHDGSMSTIHANTPRDALFRLENMVLMAAGNLPLRALRAQIASAINIIVQIERMRDGIRRVERISEISGMEGEIVSTRDIFVYKYAGERGGRLEGTFEPSRLRPDLTARAAEHGLEKQLLETVGIGVSRDG